MNASLPIGEFSRATHLSIKTLRHYHRVGLLEPADTDPHTGYRRCTSAQIPAAQIIRRFRALKMPVEEIASVLAAGDIGTRNALIAAHLTRTEDQMARTRASSNRFAPCLRARQPLASPRSGGGG
jgi:DNA-binding transcriptional MerR regulator